LPSGLISREVHVPSLVLRLNIRLAFNGRSLYRVKELSVWALECITDKQNAIKRKEVESSFI
jgi:hypothetical protein